MTDPAVSIVVIAYNMARELPRTLASLSPRMQRDVEDLSYEVIVVDNGSDVPVPEQADPRVSVIRIADATPSPAAAANRGIAASRGALVGVFIDGARMASPGLIHHATLAARMHPRPVIGSLAFHLGSGLQRNTIAEGYDLPAEDALLAASNWESDGYQLFGISAFAGSSSSGWFAPITESSALFMPRFLWDEIGGYEERFASPGGGLVNLDTWERACSLPEVQVVTLLGEGTFHQLHGGASTNAAGRPWDRYHEEYLAIRRRPFRAPTFDPIYLGRLHPSVLPSVATAAARALDRIAAPTSTNAAEPETAADRAPSDKQARVEAPVADEGVAPRPLRNVRSRMPLPGRRRAWRVADRVLARLRPNPLFDRAWYLATYADVTASGLDPYRHFRTVGVREGRDPNAVFDTDWYLEQNPDVRKSGLNPLDHYLRFGADEGRDPSPGFETDWYLRHNPDVGAANVNPLLHYLRAGAAEGRLPRRPATATHRPARR